MEIVIGAVGRPRDPNLAAAIRGYEARLTRYFRFQSFEVPPARLPDRQSERARTTEAAALLARTPRSLELVAVCREGEGMDSRALADYLGRMATYAKPGVAFLIGGAFGLGAAVLDRARRVLSLSEMTLPHELARLVLTEQLYRAATILRGEPYHKTR